MKITQEQFWEIFAALASDSANGFELTPGSQIRQRDTRCCPVCAVIRELVPGYVGKKSAYDARHMLELEENFIGLIMDAADMDEVDINRRMPTEYGNIVKQTRSKLLEMEVQKV